MLTPLGSVLYKAIISLSWANNDVRFTSGHREQLLGIMDGHSLCLCGFWPMDDGYFYTWIQDCPFFSINHFWFSCGQKSTKPNHLRIVKRRGGGRERERGRVIGRRPFHCFQEGTWVFIKQTLTNEVVSRRRKTSKLYISNWQYWHFHR